MKTGNVLLGILGGFITGAAVGILFAPDKGCNTRKKIAQKGKDLKDSVKDGYNDFITSVEDQYSNLTSRAEDLMKDGKENIERINKEIRK